MFAIQTSLVCFLLSLAVPDALASRILFIPMQQRSHVMEHLGAATELVSRGHHIYVALSTTFPKAEEFTATAGVTLLLYKATENQMEISSEEFERFIANSVFVTRDKIKVIEVATKLSNRDCTYMMEDEHFLAQVKSIKFDLVVADGLTFQPCSLILPHNLSIPFVSISAVFHPWMIRSPSFPSFLLIFAILQYSYPSNFWNRVKSLINHSLGYNLDMISSEIWNKTLLNKYSNEYLSDWRDLLRRSQLFLWERDHHLDFHIPTFPNMILVPGLTVEPPKAVGGDLGHILNTSNGRRGIVLVSFGSTSHYMPRETVIRFLEAFDGLPYTFIVKFDIEDGVDVPSNVIVRTWLPQNDILGHPNTKLFITHCGNNGQYEALYHGVPMIGMPFFAEQDHNCFRLEAKRLGMRMTVQTFTSTELRQNIVEFIDNPQHRNAIQRASQRWRDEPMTPRQKAAHWIEHVIKYGGDHLRSDAMDMTLIEFLMLDVLCFVAVVILLGFLLSKKFFDCLSRKWH